MNLSTNQKLGALLAAILPLVTSMWSQQAERQQQMQVRADEDRTRLKAQQEAVTTADSASATQLNKALGAAAARVPDADSIESCWTLHTSLELLRVQNVPTPKTQTIVAAWLTYRRDDGSLLACDCGPTLRTAASRWADGAPTGSNPDTGGQVLNLALIDALRAANDECDESTPVAARHTPTPIHAPDHTTDTPPAVQATPDTVIPELTPGTGAAASPTPTSTQAGPAPPALAFKSPKPGARIYIQVPSANAKKIIRKVLPRLRDAGYRVHEIDVVGVERSPRCAELRYIYAADELEAKALLDDINQEAAIKWLRDQNVLTDEFRPQRLSRYQGRALNRVYELWLPRNGGKDCK